MRRCVKKLKAFNNDQVKCIPCTEEKYISFNKRVAVDTYTNKEDEEKLIYIEIRFIDSFRFMASSFDALSKNLFTNQCTNFYRNSIAVDSLFYYPYEYIDSVNRLDETQLPTKSAFYSRLNDSEISDEDYNHAKEVWKEFQCKTLRDYHDLYNKSDVLLLADVFENFSDVCMANYTLDPA